MESDSIFLCLGGRRRRVRHRGSSEAEGGGGAAVAVAAPVAVPGGEAIAKFRHVTPSFFIDLNVGAASGAFQPASLILSSPSIDPHVIILLTGLLDAISLSLSFSISLSLSLSVYLRAVGVAPTEADHNQFHQPIFFLLISWKNQTVVFCFVFLFDFAERPRLALISPPPSPPLTTSPAPLSIHRVRANGDGRIFD